MKKSAKSKYYDLLAEFGYDTSKCLSLTIGVDEHCPERKSVKDDQGNLIYSNVLNRILAGEEIPEDVKLSFFGESSRFFGRIMNDGNIFNPYIHRRFLPSQFIRYFRRFTQNLTCRRFKYTGVYYIRFSEMLSFYKTEAEKITLLEKTDYIAYLQRSACVSLTDLKEGLTEIFEAYQEYTTSWGEKIIKYMPTGAPLYSHNGDEWHAFEQEVSKQIESASTYEDIIPIIHRIYDCPFFDMNNRVPLFDYVWFTYFTYTYFLCGVYFTLTSFLSFGNQERPYILPETFPCDTSAQMVRHMKNMLFESKDKGLEAKVHIYKTYCNWLYDFMIKNNMTR